MTEANLQADGLVEEPTQRAVDLRGMEGEDSSPHNSVKDAQTDEKHCYHCRSPDHFICNCLLMKATRDKKQLNGKEGMEMVKGAQTPLNLANAMKSPQQEAQEA